MPSLSNEANIRTTSAWLAPHQKILGLSILPNKLEFLLGNKWATNGQQMGDKWAMNGQQMGNK
jgi:hypothetical protein